MKSTWEQVGVIGVDAGLCWLGDPCYVLHKDSSDLPKALGASWRDFCGRLAATATQFNYDAGHPGLGVCITTGEGDGVYPVEVQRTSDGRIAAVRVVFLDVDADQI